ncbi:MAG: hypothetical protein RSB34_07165 [Muribaculaceae bacterium]
MTSEEKWNPSQRNRIKILLENYPVVKSFNAKIKMFCAQLRGVSDPAFFIFRLTKLFA